MEYLDYDSPSSIKSFLEGKGLAMQKKFGQNFLINKNARVRLIDSLEIDSTSTVWEVGPGLGAMTEEILSRGATLTAFEIDRGFAECIFTFFNSYIKSGHFKLIQGDVLKTWKDVYKEKGLPNRFFGNLPYNVAATIIADMIALDARFEKVVVTVQKEVAQRMCARVGDSDYSSFSVLCQWAYDIKPLMDLSGGNFWPKPNVDSRAVIMNKKKNFPCCNNPTHFQKILRAVFSSRRKTIKNNLTSFYGNSDKAMSVIIDAAINPLTRAEELSLEELLRLSDISNSYIM
ncbi:MAG: ribosomal RNA small subunit methyltransferase A [Spirochaetaceae bacterium]|nr:ribosomal RNA small subunit methyltransferase A [Spirochaetaceae bacterium]